MTLQPFPLGSTSAPAPAYYVRFTWPARNAIHYVGDTVTCTLSQATATGYYVLDYYGNQVASGTPSGTTLSLGSSWNPGWYRIYLTGTVTNDTWFGPSYGVTSFGVIRANANFPTLPVSTSGNALYAGGYIPNGQGGANLSGPAEVITRACLGVPTVRMFIQHVYDPNGTAFDTLNDQQLLQATVNQWWMNPTYADPVRPRKQWLAFSTGALDSLTIQPNYLKVACKAPTIDGSKVFVSATAGGGTGGTDIIRVYYPNSFTLVETYDNITSQQSAQTAINAASNYIYTWNFSNVAHPTTLAATAIGDSYRQGVIQIVSTLYPLGVTHYEGPYNEPSFEFGIGTPTASQVLAFSMQMLQAFVHMGNASAKAIGPCHVDITDLTGWDAYLAACVAIGYSPDGISFHDYNSCLNGDHNQARNNIEEFLALLTTYGFQNKELWQTEANQSMVMQGTIHNPRRARVALHHMILWEQYGLIYERNPYWYDWSDGFWSYPSFLFNGYAGDKSPSGAAILQCVYAQELFGKAYHHRVDFGSVAANNIFFGSVYGDARAGSVAVLCCGSAMPNSTVVLTVTGTASALTVIDGLGNSSSVSQSSGRVTVTVPEIPVYIRLPAGVNISVYSVRDWGHAPNPNVGAGRISATLGGNSAPGLVDGKFLDLYTADSNSSGITFSSQALPDAATVLFGQNFTIDRVVVWSGACYQAMPELVAYTVDTWDGSSWTTRATVSKTPPTSFWHGADFTNTGTTRETFWDEQWIEDVTLTPVSCKGVRVTVTASTYGGEPDSAAAALAAPYGQAATTPKLVIQDIAVFSATAYSAGNAYDTEVLADSPSFFFDLAETSGTTAVSQVNSPAADGTWANTPVLHQPGLLTDGSFSVLLPETDQPHLVVPDGANTDFGDVFTLEIWFSSTSFIASQVSKTLFSKGGGAYLMIVSKTAFTLYQQPSNLIFTGPISLSLNQTYHAVITKNGSDVHAYLNGVEVTGTTTNFTCVTNSTALSIGNPIGNVSAYIAKPAGYPTALSADRVLAHYVAGIAPNSPINLTAPTLEGG